MKHKGTKTLHTERLTLRRFYLGDAEAMFRNWASDPVVTRFLSWPTHKTSMDSVRVVRSWEPDFFDRAHYNWCIELDSLGESIGSVSCNTINDEIEGIEIGYCLSRAYWGQGIMSEAVQEIISFFIEEVGVKRIEARHDVANVASGRVMEKCGMKPEGILRQAGRNNLGVRDIRVCAILASDYYDLPLYQMRHRRK